MIEEKDEECGLCDGQGEECESRGVWQKCSLCNGTGLIRPSRGAEQSNGRSLRVGVPISPFTVAEGNNGGRNYKLRKVDNLTLNFSVTREFRFRMTVGLWLMKIGGRITGATIEVDRQPPVSSGGQP